MKPLRLSVLFFSLAREKSFIKMHRAESSCVTGPEKILFAGAYRASFSPEILHDRALKGLMKGLVRSRYSTGLGTQHTFPRWLTSTSMPSFSSFSLLYVGSHTRTTFLAPCLCSSWGNGTENTKSKLKTVIHSFISNIRNEWIPKRSVSTWASMADFKTLSLLLNLVNKESEPVLLLSLLVIYFLLSGRQYLWWPWK